MIKVVFDTNIIISGLNFPSGSPAKVLELAVLGVIKNVTSDHILREVDYVLSKKFRWDKENTRAAIAWLKLFSKTARPKKKLKIISHEADNRILECAVSSRTEFIITGDKHLLSLKIFRGIKILTPSEFFKLFN